MVIHVALNTLQISCKQKIYYSKDLSRTLQLKTRLPIKLIKINLHISLDNQRKCTLKINCELYKKDCRKTWNTINEVLKSKNKKHNFMVNDKFITSEGTSCIDKNEIVELQTLEVVLILSYRKQGRTQPTT